MLAIREGTVNEVEHLIPLRTQANSFDIDQLALWEHIRQYMEEGGPPLQPNDELRKTDLSRVPTFPPEILVKVGGQPLDEAGIKQQIEQALSQSQP